MCKYVVMDLEMCHVSAKVPQYRNKLEIIQIGAVLLDENFEITERFNTYVAPQYGELDSYITNLTGITEKDLTDAPHCQEALAAFLAWIPEGDTKIVSWSKSDKKQIYNEAGTKEIDLTDWQPYMDTWIDAQKVFSEKMNSSKSYGLTEALFISNITPEGTMHDGLSDAYNTAVLFRKMMTEKEFTINEYYYSVTREETEHLSSSLGDLLKGFTFS